MTQEYQEGYLKFSFSDDWYVIKFDEQPEYLRLARDGGQQQLPGVKGVDFVGILGGALYLIEAKDFRRHRIENRERLEAGALAIELGQKVHSSIACIMGFWRTSPDPDHWEPFVTVLADKERQIKVVLWLEHDLPQHPTGRRKALISIRANKYKPKLRWLTPYVAVTNQDSNILRDVEAVNLPRP